MEWKMQCAFQGYFHLSIQEPKNHRRNNSLSFDINKDRAILSLYDGLVESFTRRMVHFWWNILYWYAEVSFEDSLQSGMW